MNITEIRRALACTMEAALCNASEDAALIVCLPLDQAEAVAMALLKLEQILTALSQCEVAA